MYKIVSTYHPPCPWCWASNKRTPLIPRDDHDDDDDAEHRYKPISLCFVQ